MKIKFKYISLNLKPGSIYSFDVLSQCPIRYPACQNIPIYRSTVISIQRSDCIFIVSFYNPVFPGFTQTGFSVICDHKWPQNALNLASRYWTKPKAFLKVEFLKKIFRNVPWSCSKNGTEAFLIWWFLLLGFESRAESIF